MSEGILQLHTYMYLLICTLTICTFVHRKLSRNEHYKFVELRRQVESQQGSSGGRGDTLWLPSNGFKSTGLYSDIVQVSKGFINIQLTR